MWATTTTAKKLTGRSLLKICNDESVHRLEAFDPFPYSLTLSTATPVIGSTVRDFRDHFYSSKAFVVTNIKCIKNDVKSLNKAGGGGKPELSVYFRIKEYLEKQLFFCID